MKMKMPHLGSSSEHVVLDCLLDALSHGVEGVEVRVLPAHERGSKDVSVPPDPHGPVAAEQLIGHG